MTRLTLFVAAVAVAAFAAVPAAADWDPNDPTIVTKWVQLPDLEPTGLDVLATWHADPPGAIGKVLADDWKCDRTGPITDVHVWGSWLNDLLPVQGPEQVAFELRIYSDIPADPAGVNGEWSRPGELLWEKRYQPPSTDMRAKLYADAVQEQFYDPNQNEMIGTDTQVWLYNFDIPLDEAFVQKQGTIYWLSVQAAPHLATAGGQAVFGWKTSINHFNDDAVFADNVGFVGPAPNPDQWFEMRYPSFHPFGGESIDLAFAITTIPEPASLALMLVGLAAPVVLLRRWRR